MSIRLALRADNDTAAGTGQPTPVRCEPYPVGVLGLLRGFLAVDIGECADC